MAGGGGDSRKGHPLATPLRVIRQDYAVKVWRKAIVPRIVLDRDDEDLAGCYSSVERFQQVALAPFVSVDVNTAVPILGVTDPSGRDASDDGLVGATRPSCLWSYPSDFNRLSICANVLPGVVNIWKSNPESVTMCSS